MDRDEEAEVENKLQRSQKMDKRIGETTQQGWQGHGKTLVCRGWPQVVRTWWPEPRAEAHQGRRSAEQCLVSTAARRAAHPGETSG